MRVIYKCENAKCKHVWAVDYDVPVQGHWGNRVYVRMVSGRSSVNAGADCICPECRRETRKKGPVRGFVNGHKCDAKCLNARGLQCNCSCAGKNHGQSFLCENLNAA